MSFNVIKLLLVGGVLLYLIVSISGSYLGLRRAEYMIVSAENELAEVNLDRSNLEGQLDMVAHEFVEKEARDKLNLVRPGETVVLLPEDIPMVVEKERESQVEIERDWWAWMLGED